MDRQDVYQQLLKSQLLQHRGRGQQTAVGGVRFLPEKSNGVEAPILLGSGTSCFAPCGVRVSSLCCVLSFTIWVTPGNRLTKRLTSRPFCFTTGFPGSPKGSSLQLFPLNSKSVHRTGGTEVAFGHVPWACLIVANRTTTRHADCW